MTWCFTMPGDKGLARMTCVGGVYTIRAVRLSQDLDTKGEPACLLAEIFNSFNPFSGKEPGFLQSRFRPAVERKTDITVFTEILRKATKPAPATPVALQP
jgi:hypothetical protein